MQDQERFEGLRAAQQRVEELRQQMIELGRQSDQIEQDAAQLLAGLVMPCHREWRPAPGDLGYYVHVLDGIYFQVVVREVLGSYVRTQAAGSHHTAYYSVVLDAPPDEYRRAACIVPPRLFDILIRELPLQLAPFV